MRLLFALFLYILTAGAQAQQINTVKPDSFFNALESHGKSMGTFAIAKNGKLGSHPITLQYIHET